MGKFYSNSVVCMNPSPFDIRIKETNKKWIMLPSKEYKVLVPYPTDKELNFFLFFIQSLSFQL